MNPLHFNLMIELRSAKEWGATVALLLPRLRVSGHRGLTEPELLKALRDLADQSYVMSFTSALGNPTWKITKHGENALTEEGA